MNAIASELKTELEALREEGLYRELQCLDSPQSPRIKINERELLNFSSNDYLGLANHPALKEAAIRAIEQFGAGAGASRLVCGSLAVHHELDEAIAAFKGTEAALSFSTGYAAAVGTIGALMGRGDVIVIDRLVHASIVDAARLCGAKLRVFRHNDLNDLERILKATVEGRQSKAQSPKPKVQSVEPRVSMAKFTAHNHFSKSRKQRVLVVTESVFSMDGDHAPLNEIVKLKEQHGVWLMVDEAHAVGLYGTNRRGLAEEQGVSDQIEIQMGTLGKAIGACGGYICGSRPLIDCLINRARSFLFSTAPVPAAAAAAAAGARLVGSEAGEDYRQLLWRRVSQLHDSMSWGSGSEPGASNICRSAIIPLMVGEEKAALGASGSLRQQGILIPAIRYPTVGRGKARLRLTLTAAHSEEELGQLATALKGLNFKFRI